MKKVETRNKTPWQVTLISIFFFVIATRTLFAVIGSTKLLIQLNKFFFESSPQILFFIIFILQITFTILAIIAGVKLLTKKKEAYTCSIITAIIGMLLITTTFIGQVTTIDVITRTLYTIIYVTIIVYAMKEKKKEK
ncbi:hypothetical protein K9M74_05595 [Candidatus Woesearchaeota archaeon]|nr:hypothetical protein [Candidatus Woesearchaeota archaeon]